MPKYGALLIDHFLLEKLFNFNIEYKGNLS